MRRDQGLVEIMLISWQATPVLQPHRALDIVNAHGLNRVYA